MIIMSAVPLTLISREVEEVRAGLVHLVDEHNPRHLVAIRLTPHGFGLRLNARIAVQQNHGTIKHRQRPFHFNREVNRSEERRVGKEC